MSNLKPVMFTAREDDMAQRTEQSAQPGLDNETHNTADQNALFPIAEDSTLPLDHYEGLGPDTSYPRDQRRMECLEVYAQLAASEPDDSLHDLHTRLESLFATAVLEPTYLEQFLEGMKTSGRSYDGLASAEKHAFFEPLDVASLAEGQRLAADLYAVPPQLWKFAFADPETTHDVLSFFRRLRVHAVSSVSSVAELLQDAGIEGLRGADRLRLLSDSADQIAQCLLTQSHEDEQAAVHSQERREMLQERKRIRLDTVDGATHAACTNHGVIVDPSYLFSAGYEELESEPLAFQDKTWRTVRHMVAGFFELGNDHTFLYKNTLAANSRTGVPPDYNVIRPGNFLFHDLKLIEYGPERFDFDYDYLFEYVLLHYLDKMDLYIGDEDAVRRPDARIDAAILSNHENDTYYSPLIRNRSHVIPFRALKKNFCSEQYFEYDTSCYLAELVDIALQFDRATEKNHYEAGDGVMIGGERYGTYARSLLEQIFERTSDYEALSVAIRQLLFMRGAYVSDGERALTHRLKNEVDSSRTLREFVAVLSVKPILKEDGRPEPYKPPLTCYYHWFNSFAKPVPTDTVRSKGLPVKPAVFAQ